MTGNEMLEKLLDSYKNSYDIERSYQADGDLYDAYARFNVTSAKYVLVKKAELWRANCFEHVFFKVVDQLMIEELDRFRELIDTYIEPRLVREGKKYTDKDHMYSFITAVYICEDGLTEEAKAAVKKFSFMKNYLMGIRGYSQARVLVFDLQGKKVFGNRMAKDLVKGYSKIGCF